MGVGASDIFELEVRAVSNVHRKHPVSIAVSMALLAAASSAAMASEQTGTPAANAGAQSPAQQDVPTTATPDTKKAKPRSDVAGTGQGASKDAEDTVTVVGVRASQIRAIELKRDAPSIQDSISAESIGQLPDVTITDALQRITGVQINRDAGVGSSVDVRGLPQVGTMLNGEVFISPDQIDSQQPDFATLPATLFNQVDVIKSPTASQTVGGISGSLNLHTFRPWDLPSGFTYSYNVDGERGSVTRKNGPEANGLFAFNDEGRWGLQLSGDYSDTTRTGTSGGANANGNVSQGLDQYGVIFNGTNPASAAAYNGFLGAWNGATIPSQIQQNADGSVTVNGKSNAVFMGSQNIGIYDTSIERKRKAGNASFQADFGHGFTLTSDYFYGQQDQWDRNVGLQFNSTNWQGATYVPLQSRNTGATALSQYNTPPADPNWTGSQIYTTQVYEKWPGDVESYTQVIRRQSTAQNLNLQLDFDNGGPFTAGVRGIRETARQEYVETDVNISDSDGCLWADPNSSLSCGTFVYPTQLGGDRVFNANGIPQNTVPVTFNTTGRNLAISMPASLAADFANPNAWTMKTLESGEDYNRNTAVTALRFDGHYKFDDGLHLNFGVRNSIHTADNDGFTLVTPVYGGIGATNPDGTPNAAGCLVRYAGSDVILSGNATANTADTWCTAGNSEGAFRAGPISSQQLSKTPAPLANNFQQYNNLGGTGINFWAINPYAMDNPQAFWKSIYPGATTQASPAFTWSVSMKELATYLQADFKGTLADMTYSGNVGARVIHTDLDITQHLTGSPGQYGTEPADAGTQVTRRSYNDVLPALNFALNVTEKMTVRLSASKNMQPLDLSQWGGGLQLNYSLQETKTGPLYVVSTGNSAGNPSLNPWRSTNFGASFEYYINPTSMINLELFRINVRSFIKNGAVTNCNLPDEDGVVRGHCIAITEPLQGSGNSIQGAEFDYRQGFTFLPWFLSNTGMEFNFTYAPSKTGERDLAGNEIPFQDNSTESGNFVLWYQDKHFELRLAYNYRSKRAFQDSVGGIQGLEEYEAPQRYLDASTSYKFSKYAQVYLDATNLTNEYQRFYLVWPDQWGHSNFSERMFTVGVRGQW
jgi:TonB-dependent receptor